MDATRLPALQAVMAAALFGASAPLAKLLLGQVDPIPLAGLLYLGSGLGLGLTRAFFPAGREEARVAMADIPWLLGAIVAGGMAAPIILFYSLRHTPAATASLLLNFEGVATTLIAAKVFGEAVSKRIWSAIAAITVASALLSWDTSAAWGFSPAALGVVLACGLWGVDNNLTRQISAKDPLSLSALKGLGAGTCSLVLALAAGSRLPGVWTALQAMLLGTFSYGVSVMLFIRAMRSLGAARTSALFGTAPFVGAALSFTIFHEAPGALFLLSTPVMALGAWLLVSERHGHRHIHAPIHHDHSHRHDDGHHTHTHDALPPSAHSHPHDHEPVEHSHPHTPDIHHRHIH